MPADIHLVGDYECAMTEITYPYSWNNVHQIVDKNLKGNEFLIYNVKKNINEKHEIVANHYTLDGLTAALYKRFQTLRYRKHLEVSYDPLDNRVRFVFRNGFNLYLSGLMAYMLGYDSGLANGVAPNPPDMTGGLTALYVYCDILNVSVVGNTHEKLLRIVPIKGKYQDVVNHEFVNPDYIDVLHKNFSSVAITIKTDRDLPVAFKFGKAIVKLHFKRKQ